MNDSLAVSVLHRLANREEQFKPLAGRKLLGIAIVDD
jgi:hypothetical protein